MCYKNKMVDKNKQKRTWKCGQSVGMPGPWVFFHQRRSSCSSMAISVLWSSLYTALTLKRKGGTRD